MRPGGHRGHHPVRGLDREVDVAEVAPVFTEHLLAALDGTLPMSDTDVPERLAHGAVGDAVQDAV